MQQVTLAPTGGEVVEFNGELLFRLEGDDHDGQAGGRWHDIEIYRIESGSLAVSVTYRTTAAMESSLCAVDTAQDANDVDSILSLYAPDESVVMDAGSSRNRVIETVVRRYDLQVNEVLRRLQSSPEVTGTSTKPR